jgi:hypothetical protein
MAKTSRTKGFDKLKDPEKHLIAGPGGATHQTADAAQRPLTTNQGVVVADDQNTLKSGERGPSLLEDFAFREKITHFDHERNFGFQRDSHSLTIALKAPGFSMLQR